MLRKVFSLMALAALAGFLFSSSAEAAYRVQLVISNGGTLQTITLNLPQPCSESTFPRFVVSCKDLGMVTIDGLPVYVMHPESGKLLGIARADANSTLPQVTRKKNGQVDFKHPDDDFEQLGTTIRRDQIWVGFGPDGEANAAYLIFGSKQSFKDYMDGDDQETWSWGGLKTRFQTGE